MREEQPDSPEVVSLPPSDCGDELIPRADPLVQLALLREITESQEPVTEKAIEDIELRLATLNVDQEQQEIPSVLQNWWSQNSDSLKAIEDSEPVAKAKILYRAQAIADILARNLAKTPEQAAVLLGNKEQAELIDRAIECDAARRIATGEEIGRASCRERV